MNSSTLQSDLALAESAAQAAAENLLKDFRSDAGIIKAEGKDLKTQADATAESIILDVLSASPYPQVSEEAGVAPTLPPSGPCWIVDPLDGTMNFTRGFPVSCVSIALWIDASPALGVIFDLNRNCIYRGVIGDGADLNGKNISVSMVGDPGQSVLATGFPTGRSYDSGDLAQFVSKVQTFYNILL